ncbi:MAG: trehalose-phosphatase [Chloroflexi bacterium]|nr:trehalose-phosphatase [Chloroflexota bacterium]
MGPAATPPSLLEHKKQVASLLRRSRLGLVVDFDGTIAEIAPTPDQAVVPADVIDTLERLSEALALVAVVSGRAARDLEAKVGLAGVTYVGNHGAEYLTRDRLVLAEGADVYADRIGRVLTRLREVADGPGLLWQDKGLSASVHYRLAPDHERARERLAAALDSTDGVSDLEVFWGKLVLELRSPLGLHKGFAVRKLAREHSLDAVLFLGDDTTDVDGMRAVRQLAGEGGTAGLGVAVLHEDSPDELLEAADYSLNGVVEVGVFLKWLDQSAA